MTCPQCGAAVKQGDGRFCSHCGGALPDRPRITAEEWVTHRERFEQAERDPQYAIAVALPAPRVSMLRIVFPLVFLIFWIAIGSFITMGFADGNAGAIALAPAAMTAFGAIAILASVVGAIRRARAPVRRRIAVVVDERTDVGTSGSGDSRSTTTTYYATLQFADGNRFELATNGGVAGMITRGDIGLAVMRGRELADFHRFRL
jgi:Protein of unknown function (DUF2500)